MFVNFSESYSSENNVLTGRFGNQPNFVKITSAVYMKTDDIFLLLILFWIYIMVV